MEMRGLVRDVLLVAVAVMVGWWVRGADAPVSAQHSSSSSSARSTGESGLSFQFQDGSPQQSLTIYNPTNRTLYVYPRIGTGNSHISCEYMLKVASPGAPIDRQNCQIGPQF